MLEALAQGRRSGTLRLWALSGESRLCLDHGQIVQAHFGLSEGGEAALTLLRGARRLLNLEYTFEAGAPALPHAITASTPSLLARAAGGFSGTAPGKR